jgi:cysteinyl-tRNA synthetase, unknown class
MLLMSCSQIKSGTGLPFSSFRYQLHGYDHLSIERIKESHNTLWVIDESKSSEDLFSKSEISSFKNNSNLIISYLSLGEAEDYRSYFARFPRDLIVSKNPHWSGNYNIRYWRKEWSEIIDQRIEAMIEAGYDGVIYDVVDAFALYDEKKIYAKKMANLIWETSSKAKKIKNDFHIILQNASVLFEYLDQEDKNKLIKIVSGGSIENVFFEQDGQVPTVSPIVDNYIKSLKASHKWILSIEYTQQEDQIKAYLQLMNKLGILGLVTDQSLKGDFFISNKGPK